MHTSCTQVFNQAQKNPHTPSSLPSPGSPHSRLFSSYTLPSIRAPAAAPARTPNDLPSAGCNLATLQRGNRQPAIPAQSSCPHVAKVISPAQGPKSSPLTNTIIRLPSQRHRSLPTQWLSSDVSNHMQTQLNEPLANKDIRHKHSDKPNYLPQTQSCAQTNIIRSRTEKGKIYPSHPHHLSPERE